MKDYVLSLFPAALCSSVMVLWLVGFRFIDNNFVNLKSYYFLSLSILSGGLVYLAALKIFNFKEFKELFEIIKEQIDILKNRLSSYWQNGFLKRKLSRENP